MKYLKILLLISLLLASVYRAFGFGMELGQVEGHKVGVELGRTEGREEGREEATELLVLLEYQTAIANFRHCSADLHTTILAYVTGINVPRDFDSVFDEYSAYCRDLLNYSSSIIPAKEEEQDSLTAWVLFWWEGYLRQATEILIRTHQVHLGKDVVDVSFIEALKGLHNIHLRLEIQIQEAVLDVR